MRLITCFFLIFFILVSAAADAQKKPVKKPAPQKKPPVEKPVEKKKTVPPDPVADDKKVRDIIAFFEFMLNTLGSNSTSSRDKDVLVTQSYAKIFRDGKVQVEDDLDEERIVITNKNIVAYLKDVDFFFKDVKFDLTIEDVKTSTLAGGELFYKVQVRRTITGSTTEGDPVNNSKLRFIEVNYNQSDQDLKIVSIYTTGVNEEQVLKNWWNELSYEWKAVFRKKLNLADSVGISEIKRVSTIRDLNLSNNKYVQNIEPLYQLTSLQVLNLSGTPVNDITPIRNLTELTELDLSNTKVVDLSPLRYAIKLEKLNISNTDVSSIQVLEKMLVLKNLAMEQTNVADFTSVGNLTSLQAANLKATKISDLSPFINLTQLTELNVSASRVQDLSPLKNLKQLTILNLDSTHVSNIQILSVLEGLKIISINHTAVSDLSALKKLPALEKVYSDQTQVTKEAANAFMIENPRVLVILDSKDLKVWWNTLSPAWQSVFNRSVVIGQNPSKEDLAKVSLLDSINLDGQVSINNLEPLEKLPNLRSLVANKTGISDLAPIRNNKDVTYLDISDTQVRDLSPISSFKKLKILRADRSKIENIEAFEFPSLQKFYADQTAVHDITAREFLEKNPKCLLIFKTIHLNRWWSSLSESWRDILKTQLKASETPEGLHTLVELENITLADAGIGNLKALREFVRLKSLHISGANMTSFSSVESLKTLTSFHLTNSPLQKIDSIFVLSSLEDLDISNTPIDDIYPLWKLKNLKKLNCAGTQIRRLDALEKLSKLEYLDCSNTNVTKLTSLDYLPLKTLKCYNTKVSTRAIENFKSAHPDCNVIYYR